MNKKIFLYFFSLIFTLCTAPCFAGDAVVKLKCGKQLVIPSEFKRDADNKKSCKYNLIINGELLGLFDLEEDDDAKISKDELGGFMDVLEAGIVEGYKESGLEDISSSRGHTKSGHPFLIVNFILSLEENESPVRMAMKMYFLFINDHMVCIGFGCLKDDLQKCLPKFSVIEEQILDF